MIVRISPARLGGVLAAAAVCLSLGACGAEPESVGSGSSARQSVTGENAFQAEITLQPTDLTTAQRLTLTFNTRTRDGFELRGADVQAALPEDWRIVEDRTSPFGVSDGWRHEQRTLVLEPFLDGAFTIGAMELTATPRLDGDPVSVSTTPIEVTVRSVLDADSQGALADIKTIVDPPSPNRTWAWAGAGVAAAVLLAAALWLMLRKRAPIEVEPIRRAAHELAIERLDALIRSGLLEQANFKEFYAGASLILRRYIEDRFGMHAPKQTTDEFLAASKVSLALSREDVAGLENFLRACDEIKFAAGAATRAQAEATAGAVRDFVERTRSMESQVIVDPNDEPRMEVAA